MIKSNYIIHDCETGGLDKNKNPITQYACIILDYKTLKEIDRWETYVKPYNDLVIEKQALDHTMVTMSDINNGISVKKFVKTATAFWEQHRAKTKNREKGRLVSVGHNIPFDHGFLDYALRLENDTIWEYFQPGFLDTMMMGKLTWGINGDEKMTLTDCCARCKIRLTDAHGAMNDVEATADLFRWFMKKLRTGKATAAEAAEEVKRVKGQKFFEFECAK